MFTATTPDTPAKTQGATAGEPLLATIERRLAEVTVSLTTATGGAALCRIEGAGGTAKHLEGRTAALMAGRRLLRKDAEADLTSLHDQWHADLARHRQRGSSAAWLAYSEGGCAELDHLRALAESTTSHGDTP